MDVLRLRDAVLDDYSEYIRSFTHIRDARIERRGAAFDGGHLWPEPLLQLNPAFEPGDSMRALVRDGVLHPRCPEIFAAPAGAPFQLYRHQVEAIRRARAGRSYVLTTGTRSGKSLSYIVPIVDHVLRRGSGKGIQALIVYPMNALANSQVNELEKFLADRAVTFARYTGQESEEERNAIIGDPPDILLTNYVMLELVLTRVRDRRLIEQAQGLRFLVFDELHTYRGRQGADVALLVRRTREACRARELLCVGTSATLAGEGSWPEQQAEVAQVASLLFGTSVEPEEIVGETLRRVTPAPSGAGFADRLRESVLRGTPPDSVDAFVSDPLASWIESALGLTQREGRWVRSEPCPLAGEGGAAERLTGETGVEQARCESALRAMLLAVVGARCGAVRTDAVDGDAIANIAYERLRD